MTTDVIRKAIDNGLEAVDSEILAPEFAQLLLDARKLAKGGDTRLGILLQEFEKLVGSSSSTEKILQTAFGSVEGRRLAKEIARLTNPDQNASMSKGDGSAAVAARARLSLVSQSIVAKARGNAAWVSIWKGDGAERLRLHVLDHLLTDTAVTRAEFWKSAEGSAVYSLIHAPVANLPFDDAVEQLEQLSPGWIDEQLVKLGGNVAKADSAIAKIAAKAAEIQKADSSLSIEQARAQAWKENPKLYRQQRTERARANR